MELNALILPGCQRQNRGPEFLRRQIQDKVIRVARSFVNRAEFGGVCVTPVVVLDWDDDKRAVNAESENLCARSRKRSKSVSKASTEYAFIDPQSTLNFYHGEAVMETELPEDAMHRSLIARYAQFGLDAYAVVKHVASNNLKIIEAYPRSGLWQPHSSLTDRDS